VVQEDIMGETKGVNVRDRVLEGVQRVLGWLNKGLVADICDLFETSVVYCGDKVLGWFYELFV
jgi:hypothetical protein